MRREAYLVPLSARIGNVRRSSLLEIRTKRILGRSRCKDEENTGFTVKDTARTTNGNIVIQGVMYRGVQWTSGSPAAVWSTVVLNRILNSAEIPHELHGPPSL